MYDIELSDIRRKLNDLSRQIDNLARREYTPFDLPADVVRTSGTPTAGRLAQWTGAGTIEHTTYAGSSALRYSGVPSAGNIPYWTANGTVADSGFGTGSLPRYSGAPTAGRYAYWTGNGTVADSGFGTADLPRYSGVPTGSAIAYWTGAGTVAHGSVTYSHASGTPVLAPSGSHALRIHDASGNLAFNIGNGGATSSDKALHITQLATSSNALFVFRNLTSAQTDSPLVYLNNNASGDDQPTLRVNQSGAANIAEFQDSTSTVVVIKDGGHVGIHTTSASDDLAVAESGSNATTVRVKNSQSNQYAGVFTEADGAYIQQVAWATSAGGTRFGANLADAGEFVGVNVSRMMIGTYGSVDLIIGTNDTERIRIAANGDVGIGVTGGAAGKLHVAQNSTTAAIPPLVLTQSDLSEEFIEFDTTVGAGNPVDTAGVGADYGRLRVRITGVGDRYIKLSHG